MQPLQGHKLAQAACTLHAQRKMAECQRQRGIGEGPPHQSLAVFGTGTLANIKEAQKKKKLQNK